MFNDIVPPPSDVNEHSRYWFSITKLRQIIDTSNPFLGFESEISDLRKTNYLYNNKLDMNKNNLVAQRIMELREKKGILQKDFAAQIDMKVSTYSDKENGKTAITIDELYRIAEGLGTSIATLLDLEEMNTQNNNAVVVLTQNNNGTIYFQPSQDMLDKLIQDKRS